MITTPVPPITAESRLADLAQRGPALLAVIGRHGMDACCGGALTVAQAAAAHRVPLDAFLQELRAAAEV